MRQIVSQFHHPRGPLGQLAGFILASHKSNGARSLWTLELLDIQDND